MADFLIGIAVTFLLLLLFSKIRLWIGVLAGALTFGLINLGITDLTAAAVLTFSDINNWFLVLAVGLIPVLGGIMRSSALLTAVLSKLKTNKKLYLMIAPAIFGLIPIPGGALLSCPLLKGFDDDNISNSKYVAINIWFRHIFIIIYPLSSSLIIASQLAGLTISTAISFMLPFTIIMLILGHRIMLADVKNEIKQEPDTIRTNNNKEILYLAIILLSAPILHLTLASTILHNREQLSFLISMIAGITIAVTLSKLSLKNFIHIFLKSKIDQFSLLFLFLLLFINVIRAYENLDTIFIGYNPPLVLVGLVAFLLSFISGRIEIALSIVYPLVFAAYGSATLPGILFSFIYFSLFAGYLVSPLHPCIVFSIEFFETKYIKVLVKILPLILIPLALISLIVTIIY